MATKDTRRRLAPPTPVPGHTLDPSSGDAMPRTVPSLASLGAVSAGIPEEATAHPPKGRERHSNVFPLLLNIMHIFKIHYYMNTPVIMYV